MYLIASAAFLNINNLLIELSFGFKKEGTTSGHQSVGS
jgi:hypothetical protein